MLKFSRLESSLYQTAPPCLHIQVSREDGSISRSKTLKIFAKNQETRKMAPHSQRNQKSDRQVNDHQIFFEIFFKKSFEIFLK